MSYISDYFSGNTDKAEFDMYGDMENRQERWEEEHKYEEPCDDSNANQHNFNALNDVGQHTNALEGDAVSRQAVLDLIEHYNSDGLGLVFYGYEEGVKFANAVNKLPSVRPQEPISRWIPVSERLPEEDTAVLIWCTERRNIYCAYLEEKQWWIFGAYFQKVPLEVIAWMPLPKPYEPQERSGEE